MSEITGMIDTASMDQERPKDYRQELRNMARERYKKSRVKKQLKTFTA